MDRNSPIDRKNGISAWKQIAGVLSAEIAAGEYDMTGMVPPEMALAGRFGVNRHTVRSAIAVLADDGLVRRVPGRGTIIEKKQRFVFPISRRTRFSQALAGQSEGVDLVLVAEALIAADRDVANALRVPSGVPIIRLDMNGIAAGAVLSFARCWFPADRFPGMAAHFKIHHSVTKAFAAQGVADYMRSETEVIARTASTDEAMHLQISPGSVVLETIYVNCDMAGVPVQFARTVFNADKVALKMDVGTV